MTEQSEIQNVRNLSDMTSFNAYGVVELVDGQKAKIQMTFRHGMSNELASKDLDNFVAFLEHAASIGIKLDGPNPLPAAPEAPSGNVSTEPAGKPEPVYENVDGSKMYTIAGVFHDKTSTGKDVLKVVTVEPPYNTKYGVSSFHPSAAFEGWKSWPVGTKESGPIKYAPPKGAGHVVIKPAVEGVSKYPDVLAFSE